MPDLRSSHQQEVLPQSIAAGDLVLGIVEAAPDGIVVIDGSGSIVLVNHRTEELFGWSRADLVGQAVEVLLPERFRQVHLAHRTRYRADPRTRSMGAGLDLLGRRRDGTDFPVEISLSPFASGDALTIAVVRDVTGRRQSEREAARVHAMLDATKDALFIFDGESLRFSYVNEGAIDQVGYSRDELLGMTPLHINPVLDDGSLRAVLEDVRETGRPRTITTVHRRRDGSDVPVEMLLQCSPDAADGTFVAAVRDIRERLDAEQKLRAAEDNLRLLEERERIARDLHDLVIQRLFASGMALQGVIARTPDADVVARIATVVDDLDDTIRELRTVIFALQTRSRDSPGLRARVLAVVEAERPALGFEPRVTFDGAVDLVDDAIAEQLLPTLREALSNVARHAAATEAAVSVRVDAQAVNLRVTDNGIGLLEQGADDGTGNGIRNAKRRAASLRGTCTIVNAADDGTMLEWQVPVGE